MFLRSQWGWGCSWHLEGGGQGRCSSPTVPRKASSVSGGRLAGAGGRGGGVVTKRRVEEEERGGGFAVDWVLSVGNKRTAEKERLGNGS